jgi:hypothetical protein
MAHTLLDPEINDTFGTAKPLHKYACSCGGWRRIYHEDFVPNLQQIESDHSEHQHHAGAEELRAGKPEAEALEDTIRAMAALATASVKATETFHEFVLAHKEAQQKGIGVVVVRRPDGSTTSTPNVFVPVGTAIFMDEPGLFVPSGPLELVPENPSPRYFLDHALPPKPARIIDTGGIAA